VLGRRSYKSDEKAKQTPERLIARKDLVDALEQGRQPWGLRLRLSHAQREALVEDARGDTLDAVLCLLQAAWGRPATGRLAGGCRSPGGVDPGPAPCRPSESAVAQLVLRFSEAMPLVETSVA
jgi:hypothetical protein